MVPPFQQPFQHGVPLNHHPGVSAALRVDREAASVEKARKEREQWERLGSPRAVLPMLLHPSSALVGALVGVLAGGSLIAPAGQAGRAAPEVPAASPGEQADGHGHVMQAMSCSCCGSI